MQPVSVILLFALLICVAWFVGQPFARRGLHRMLADDGEVSSLLAERERVLDALQELDFDHLTGKVPPDEYSVQRAALLKKGVAVLRQLDGLQGGHPPAGSQAEYEERLAQGVQVQLPDALSDDEIEALIAARRVARKARSGGFCPSCGKPVLASDRFCPSCGRPVQGK